MMRRIRCRWPGPVAIAAGLTLLAGGCSSVPDAVNPISWYDSAREAVFGGADDPELAAERARPIPGEDRPFPNLASVPGEPPQPSPAEERRAVAEALIADLDNARYIDDGWRDQTPPDPLADERPLPAPTVERALPAPTVEPAAPVDDRPPPAAPPAATELSPAAARAAAIERVMPDLYGRRAEQDPPAAAPAQPAAAAPPPDMAAVPQPATPVAPLPETSAAPPPPPEPPREPSYEERFASLYAASGLPPAAPGAAFSPAGVATSVHAGVITFPSSGTSLDDADRAVLREIAAAQKRHGGIMRVIGHSSGRSQITDPVRHKLVNFEMSLRRAQAVAAELIRQGIEGEAILVSAASDSQPLYSEATPLGEAANRRVEIYIDYLPQ